MWQDYQHEEHTVVGSLKVKTELYSPQLKNGRQVLAYLPPSYESSSQRYPVIYMHDGQNLFDALTSFAGEWGVDETMQALSREGLEAIVVGIPNNEKRQNEYNPYDNRRFGKGRGDAYVRYIVETVKPEIDSAFRTLPDNPHTGIMGSSMGGLISLYAYLQYPQVFGFAGAMSPAFWIAAQEIIRLIERLPRRDGKLYIDIGTGEMPRRTGMLPVVPRIVAHLKEKGYHLKYVEERGGLHNEDAWRRRLPDALRFLLAN